MYCAALSKHREEGNEEHLAILGNNGEMIMKNNTDNNQIFLRLYLYQGQQKTQDTHINTYRKHIAEHYLVTE